MKKLLLLFLCVTLNIICFGQKALHYEQAKKQGINVKELDSLYASGIHTDENLSVFKGNTDKYTHSYQMLLQDLGKFLKKNNFNWEKTTRGFNRIYFDKSGKIDYFLFSFRPDQISPEKEEQFRKLLEEFISTYTFPLSADRNFAQCSPVTYLP